MITPMTEPAPTPWEPAPGGVEIAPGVRIAPAALTFSFVASAGPGGQNVNKKATKAELRLRLSDIPLHHEALARLASIAGSHLTVAGEIVITADEHRSQGRNRDECLDRLRDMIVRARVRPKTRRATRPTRGSRERRLSEKKSRSDIKSRRQRPDSRAD